MKINKMIEIKISPSCFKRYMLCPAAARAESLMPKSESSQAADKGTYAHAIAAAELKNRYSLHYINKINIDYSLLSTDEQESVKIYIEYIDNIWKDLVTNARCMLSIGYEVNVKLDHILSGMSGTVDAYIYQDKENVLHIFDYKHGNGVKVDVINNPQLELYALGLIENMQINPESIYLHIVQPRMNNIEFIHYTLEELESKIPIYKQAAALAMSEFAPRVPSLEACQFCRAKPVCGALHNKYKEVIKVLEKPIANISKEEVANVFENKDLVKKFLDSVEKYIKEDILQGSNDWNYKLVNGTSRRYVIKDELEKIENLTGVQLHNKVPMTLTEIEKAIGKELLAQVTEVRDSGNLSLVPISDKRRSAI
jgi:hypothetical protein